MVDVRQGATPARPRLAVGAVIRDSFATFGRAPATLILVSLLPMAVALVSSGLQFAAGPDHALKGLIAVVGGVLQAVVTLIVQGTVTVGAARLLAGRAFGIRSAAGIGLGRAPALFVVGLLVGLTVVAGMLCLVVPGIIAAAGLAVAVPASIVEELGPIASLQRSWSLTAGNRWRVIGLVLTLLLLIFALYAVAFAIVAGLVYGAGVLGVSRTIAALAAVLVAIPVFAGVVGFASVLPVALFHHLGGGASGPWGGPAIRAEARGIPV